MLLHAKSLKIFIPHADSRTPQSVRRWIGCTRKASWLETRLSAEAGPDKPLPLLSPAQPKGAPGEGTAPDSRPPSGPPPTPPSPPQLPGSPQEKHGKQCTKC